MHKIFKWLLLCGKLERVMWVTVMDLFNLNSLIYLRKTMLSELCIRLSI